MLRIAILLRPNLFFHAPSVGPYNPDRELCPKVLWCRRGQLRAKKRAEIEPRDILHLSEFDGQREEVVTVEVDMLGTEGLSGLVKAALPARYQASFVKHGFYAGRPVHPARTAVEMLWGGGRCAPVGYRKITTEIGRRREWTVADGQPVENGFLRDRLRQVVRRLNGRLHNSKEWKGRAAVRYRTNGTYQLVVDPDEVAMLGKEATTRREYRYRVKRIGIMILAEAHSLGLPVLHAHDPLAFELTTPVAGYLHLFHLDACHHLEKFFPCDGSKILTVRANRRKPVRFPKDVLKEAHGYTVDPVKSKREAVQKIMAVVVRKDVEIAAAELARFGVPVKARGLTLRRPTFKGLKDGEIAYGEADYCLITSKRIRHGN